jgi:hypothetical protein
MASPQQSLARHDQRHCSFLALGPIHKRGYGWPSGASKLFYFAMALVRLLLSLSRFSMELPTCVL